MRGAMAETFSLHRFTWSGSEQQRALTATTNVDDNGDERLDEAAQLFAVLSSQVADLSRHKARQAVMSGLVQVDGALQVEAKCIVPVGAEVIADLRQGIPKNKLIAQRQAGTLGNQIVGTTGHSEIKGGVGGGDKHAIEILYQDDDIIVVNKAAGVMAAPFEKGQDGTVPQLLQRLLRKRKQAAPFIGVIHRIDKETSGCMVLACNQRAQRILGEQFATHAAERRYVCLVNNNPRQDKDTLTGKLGRGRDGRRAVVPEHMPGKDAITHFSVAQRYTQATRLDVQLETGRTHQIRIHLASIGCWIIGDQVYKPRSDKKQHLGIKAPRLMLHAHSLHFDHPATGQRIDVTAPVPKLFGQMEKRLAQDKTGPNHSPRTKKNINGSGSS